MSKIKDMMIVHENKVKDKLIPIVGIDNYNNMTLPNRTLLMLLLKGEGEGEGDFFNLCEKLVKLMDEIEEIYNEDKKNDEDKKEEEVDIIKNLPDNIRIHVSSFVCNIMGEEICTPFGLKITEGLIRVASIRIFSDPEQSIMELVSNSIDSYRREKGISTIGKFGMGFFSILYWISPSSRYKKSYITIVSTYKEKDKFITYNVIIRWDKEGLNIVKEEDNSESIKKTGTKISIYSYYDSNSYNMLYKYLFKMVGIKDAKIIIDKEQINSKEYVKIGDSDDNIFVEINKEFFSVTDFSTGIPLNVLYNSLLVPSSSTKTRILKDKVPESNFVIRDNLCNSLSLRVNGITIVNFELGGEEDCKEYIINFPLETSLPVSREDIIYTEFEYEYLKKTILDIIAYCIITYQTIIPFINLIDEYLKSNKQELLFNIVLEVKKEILELNNTIFIPHNTFWISFADAFLKNKSYCYYQYADKGLIYDIMKDELDSISVDNIFKMRKCITLDLKDSIIESNEFSYYTFVNVPDFSEENVNKLMLSSNDTLLIPFNSNNNISKKISLGFFTNSSNIIRYVNIIFMTFRKKFQNIDIDEEIIHEYIQSVVNFLEKDEENILKNFLIKLNSKLSSIKLSFTYGMKKQIFYTNSNSTLYTKNRCNNYFLSNRISLIDKTSLSNKDYIYYLGNTLMDEKYIINYNTPKVFDENFKEKTLVYYELFKTCNSINTSIANYYVDNMNDETHNNIIISAPIDTVFFDNFTRLNLDSIKEFINVKNTLYSEEEVFFYGITIKYFLSVFESIITKNANIFGIFTFIVKELRRKFSNDYLKNILKMYVQHLNGDEIVNIIVYNINLGCSKIYNILVNKYSNHVNPDINYNYSFSCKKLLSYVFNNNTDNMSREELFKNVNDYEYDISETKLQIVEIAVNEGTTKIFSESVITELYQNSKDAIFSNNIDNNKVSILTFNDAFSIHDNCGFSELSTIISLLIPFISSKDANDPNVNGEMGTGFFNVYRQPYTKNIHIITNKDGINTSIRATPLINEYGNVYDINYDINITDQYIDVNSTVIIICLKEPMPEIINDISIFVNSRLGSVKQKVNSINKYHIYGEEEKEEKEGKELMVYLNRKQITHNITPIIKIYNVGELYTSDELFESYVTTNNIPFCSLKEFTDNYPGIFNQFVKYSLTSVVVNISKNFFTPTQSRTKIKVNNDNDILMLINDGLYLHILRNYIKNHRFDNNNLVQFSSSEGDVDQLKIYNSNILITYNLYLINPKMFNDISKDFILPNLFQNYSILDLRFSLALLINNMIDNYTENIYNIRDMKFKNLTLQISNLICSNLSDNIEEDTSLLTLENNFDSSTYINIKLFFKSVKKWFEHKEKVITPIVSIDVKTKGKIQILALDDLNIFIDIYWTKIKEMISEGILLANINNEAPQIYTSKIENNTYGYYDFNAHNIILNNKYYTSRSLMRNLIDMKNSKNKVEFFQNNDLLMKYFASNSTTTLLHEIGHAIESTSHSSSIHSTTKIKFKEDKTYLEFDDMCLNIYRAAINRGLLSEYISEIIKKYN